VQSDTIKDLKGWIVLPYNEDFLSLKEIINNLFYK
jgi:hypothetical protein